MALASYLSVPTSK